MVWSAEASFVWTAEGALGANQKVVDFFEEHRENVILIRYAWFDVSKSKINVDSIQ